MAVGNVVGRAYIEIHADSKPFAKELGVEIEQIANAAETSKRSQNAGRTVARNVIRGARQTVRREGRNIFSRLLDDLARPGGASTTFRRLGLALGKDLGKTLGQGIQTAFQGGFNLFNKLGSSIGNVGGEGGLGAGVFVAIAALVAGAIVLIQELAGLASSLLLLPGIFASAAAGIIPLVVAFHGLGGAIQAVLSGDPKKIAEAMKTLTPAAQGVVKEFQKLLPLFHDLHTIAQQSFFKEISGSLTALFTALGPELKKGFGDVATAAGQLLHDFLALFTSPDGKKFVASMFALAVVFEQTIGPAILDIIQGLMSVAGGSADILAGIFKSIGQGLGEFGLWLDRISKDGKLQDFFNSMRKAFEVLMEVAGVTWSLAQALFGTDPESLERNKLVLDLLAGVIAQLGDFLKSDLGRHGLTAIFIILVAIAAVFSGILQVILSIGGALEWAGEKLGQFYAFLTGKPAPPKPIFLPGGPPAPPGNNVNPHGKAHADGAIVTNPEIASLAEKGPEVVIPLTNPRRAFQLLQQSGLMEMANGGGGDVIVYIGNEQVDAHIKRVSVGTTRALTRGMKYGPRTVGVA